MKVIAIKPAFHNGSRVRVGDAVEVAEGHRGTWFTSAETVKAQAKTVKPTKPQPRALSQAGKEETKTFLQAHADKADLA
jgi:hypothetical protein